MRESGYQGISLCFLGLLILLCHSCDTAEPVAIDTASPLRADQERINTKQPEAKQPETKQPETKRPETKPAVTEQKPKEQPIVKTPAEAGVNSNIVAKIGDYVITREELEKRIISELQPDYGQYQQQAEPVNAKTVLLKMIAEKAMVMDARKLNYLEDEIIQALLKQFKQRKLTRLLLASYLKGKITVTEAEIDEKIKTNPKLSRAQAQTTLGRAKANRLLSEYYRE